MKTSQNQGKGMFLDDFIGIYSDLEEFSENKVNSVQNDKYIFNLSFPNGIKNYSSWNNYFTKRKETMMSLALLMRIINLENKNISDKITDCIKSKGIITSTATCFDVFYNECNRGGNIIQDFGSKIILPAENPRYIPALESESVFIDDSLKKTVGYRGLSDSESNKDFGSLLENITLVYDSVKLRSLLGNMFRNKIENIKMWTMPFGSRKDHPIKLVGLNHSCLNISRVDMCYSSETFGHAIGVSIKKKSN